MLTYEQAYQFNKFIDAIHNPYWWSYAGVLALVFMVESYLPKPKKILSNFEKNLNYFKFYILAAFTFVFLGQGLFGGCIIQLPQNWIAQQYLNREYWYPYGLVYRESFPEVLWPLLRLFYVVIGYFSLERTWVFFNKFIKLTEPIKLRVLFYRKLKEYKVINELQAKIQNSFWF